MRGGATNAVEGPVTGSVLSLRRWPVKSMAGESVDALALDRLGATGDRTHAIFDEFKGAPRRVNAETTPRLLAWSAWYAQLAAGDAPDRADPPEPLVRSPAGAELHWSDPRLPAALAADLGRSVTLRRDPRGQQDRAGTVHVTVAASLRALAAAIGGEPLDVRRFRPNLHLALDAEAFAEEGWTGRRLRVGDAELEIVEGCERCVIPTRDPDTLARLPQLVRRLHAEHAMIFGLIARATGPATVRRGDRVRLLD